MSPSVVMNTMSTTNAANSGQPTAIEQAGMRVLQYFQQDNNFPKLVDRMFLNQGLETCSGLDDAHYRGVNALENIRQIAVTNRVPLPPEIMEQFTQMQCHCMMGLFPEIKRAWITIDSDIYIWSYEHGSDLAFYDGLNEVIVSVGLVKPKPSVFLQGQIKHLLVLTTAEKIIVLGVRFSSNVHDGPLGDLETIHLLPDPVFVIPTEVSIVTISGSDDGRLFLGGHDGSIYEIEYRAEKSWFGKRFYKKNHSTGVLSYLMPSFLTSLAYGEDDPITQISIDDSRHILYTLSERGGIQLWDLDNNGDGMSRIATASQAYICQQAQNIIKTLDVKVFRPLVYIAALEAADSSYIHMIVIAQTGARLYFSTYTPNQQTNRPSGLYLRHVRMPPGYAANSPSCPPAAVKKPLYSRGSLLLVTAPGGDKDEVWSLSPDLMPVSKCLTEAQTILPLDGKVWSACEELQNIPLSSVPSVHPPSELPPLVVRQHIEPARKFVLLTAQGAQILTKLRPVDVMRQLLADSRGADGEAVRNLFRELGEDQACATALALACQDHPHANQMTEWATRAFFALGGEPRLVSAAGPSFGAFPSPPSQGTPFQQAFQPGVFSTPRGASSPPMAQSVTFSAKHNALYLYVARILRPIWTAPVVTKVVPPNSAPMLTCSITSDDCVWVLSYLQALRAFFERNAQVTSASTLVARTVGTPQTPAGWSGASGGNDPQAEEKSSLTALKAFVAHACEVLGLWKVLCEHQFHTIAAMLDPNIQADLPSRTFMEILLNGSKLNALLINALINSYLGDCASVQSISEKLREVCPNLYRSEDAICSKANELLMAATKTTFVDEKEAMLIATLNMLKEVAPEIELPHICQQFVDNQFYAGVLQLCETCATKQDPAGVALHWYQNNEPADDVEGYQAAVDRRKIYSNVTQLFDHLFQISNSNPGIPLNTLQFPTSSHPAASQTISPSDAREEVRKLIKQAFDGRDQILHSTILEWMLIKELYGEIIEVDSPSVETFLVRASTRNPNAADLLWKYHEHHGNHAAAAKLLHQLALSKSRPVELADRVGLLARAVCCMRSERVGSAPHHGSYLQELEDLMEVALVQQKVLAAVRCLPPRPEKDIAINRLNSELMSCTDLYEQFAEPLQLWECKLAIVHSTNHNDPSLVEDIWQNLVASEIKRHASWGEKLSALTAKVSALAAEYGSSARCFPLPFIVRALEVIRCKGRIADNAFPCLLSAGVPYGNLLQVYETLSASNERTWALDGNEFHIIEAIAELTNYLTDNPSIVPTISRKAIVTKSSDLLSRSLVLLYAKPDTQDLISRLKAVESKLKRLGGF